MLFPLPRPALTADGTTPAIRQPVTGVDATHFKVVANGSAAATSPVVVSGSGTTYTVTVNGVHGSGDVRLDLIDDNSINNAGVQLGGPLVGDGSLQGQTYSILQSFPSVVSFNRTTPTASTTNASTVVFTVTFTGYSTHSPEAFLFLEVSSWLFG